MQPDIQIVEQGLDRAEVEDAESRPAFGQHPRDDRKERRLGLAARRRGEHDQVLAVENRWDDRFLERPQLAPAEAVHDVVLQGRM